MAAESLIMVISCLKYLTNPSYQPRLVLCIAGHQCPKPGQKYVLIIQMKVLVKNCGWTATILNQKHTAHKVRSVSQRNDSYEPNIFSDLKSIQFDKCSLIPIQMTHVSQFFLVNQKDSV